MRNRPGRVATAGSRLQHVYECGVRETVVTMLLGRALLSASGAWPDASFVSALGGSLRMALAVGAIALGLGLPTGVMAALYRFPGRTWLLTLVMLPTARGSLTAR